ncbi:MAG: hypothetical protein GW938_13415 [Leptospira sp.]|nr:hypothetical protein [Leptospira sp.]NCS94478.1 hypothetical protein [Leptospira sp.]
MSLQILFIAIFAILAFLISTTAGFLVGNRVSYIFFVSMTSVVSFAIFGFGVHKILELKVPEFLAFLGGISMDDEFGENSSSSELNGMNPNEFREGADGGFSLDAGNTDASEKERLLQNAKSGKFGDHIVVDKIPIKNEPKLMAEAIRTMMARDDE